MQFLVFILLILINFSVHAECDRNECKFTFDITDAEDCLVAYTEGKFKKNFRANKRNMSLYYYDGYLYSFHVHVNKKSIYMTNFKLSFCEKTKLD